MLKTLFPELEPFQTHMIKVDDLHEIYVEESGKKDGAPVVFVHGGPGSGCGNDSRRFLDPDFYRIICIDQRGCGRSKPFVELRNNTIQALADDMEKVRELLGIERWLVYGGSWGTTLSLYYAENHPERVTALILRGIFLGRDEDIKWLYQGGAGMFFPEAYAEFTSLLSEDERKDNVLSYYKHLTSENPEERRKFGKAFSDFETSVVALHPRTLSEEITDGDISLAMMECHYFVNACFMEENYLLNHVDRIQDIPTFIVHGRYDVDCRPEGAHLLAQKLKNCEIVYPIAGHSSFEPEITHELILAQERFKRYFQ
ncbi:MAG: prolyl aminopeptidase [Bacillota bacterium]|nr:prolyl aminopeptidase [Bacillota bacterium]